MLDSNLEDIPANATDDLVGTTTDVLLGADPPAPGMGMLEVQDGVWTL